MKRILKFNEDRLKGLHFFTKHLNFPVAVASYSDWEEQQISYLEHNFQSRGFTTENLCQWCINHKIQYQIVYPPQKAKYFQKPLQVHEISTVKTYVV